MNSVASTSIRPPRSKTPCEKMQNYLLGKEIHPLFLQGDSSAVLADLPADIFDCVITSPPYWNKREYGGGGIGLENSYQEFIDDFLLIVAEIKRTLKGSGSFWLNIGDSYVNKGLAGIPWRIALRMIDEQGWTLRNEVIWNKLKGPDTAKDKLRNAHEQFFHFVKEPRGFFYDIDAIRSKPRATKIVNGAIVSGTGVSGVRYRRQIELSTALTAQEKKDAFAALDGMLAKLTKGELHDFRMVIRGQQRTTHSDSVKVSGRAKELEQRGFYILRYHPLGSKPSDVWDIIPEDTTNRTLHYAPFPEDLVKIPIIATCPSDGIVLDPFCGTGTTNCIAVQLGRKSVGIDLSSEYLEDAEQRCQFLL